MIIRFFLFFLGLSLWYSPVSSYAQSLSLTPEPALEHQKKKRITEILRRENIGQIEPFFYVSNRPTINEALSEQIKNRTLVSPLNNMVYCPVGTDYFSHNTTNTGAVFISAENLPKNGQITERWFQDAYRYRNTNDPLYKPANVAIISAKRQNFLRVKCPNTHNHITVASAPAHAPVTYQTEQKIIDDVKNLRYADQPELNWSKRDYTLPSHMKNQLVKAEIQAQEKLTLIELSPPPEYIKMARESAQTHGVLLKLLLAIADVSSQFNPNKLAVQGTRIGIMQLSEKIAENYQYEKEQLVSPKISFDIAARYIKDLYFRYNTDPEKVLRAYAEQVSLKQDIPQEVITDRSELFTNEVMRRVDLKQKIVF